VRIWKDHPDYIGAYQVSDDGRVRSLKRFAHSGFGSERSVPAKELSQSTDRNGYRCVRLYSGGKPKNHFVHRLILDAFVGQCPDEYECRHLDGNRSNNRPENLRWGTRKENGEDKVSHGNSLRGELNTECKLTEWDVLWIKKFLKYKFAKQQYLADVFGVSKSLISAINTGSAWGWS